MLMLDPKTTTLVLIDLQQGILPYAGVHSADTVLQNANRLSQRFRELGAPVVLVRVGWSADFGDSLKQPVDQAPPTPPGGLPANWLDFPETLRHTQSDLLIIKRQWNAFFGTELDLQLRRRGIHTIVLGGIVTGIGVESTARAGWELGYGQILVEDLCSAPKPEHHRFSFEHILPRLGRVRDTDAVLAALAG